MTIAVSMLTAEIKQKEAARKEIEKAINTPANGSPYPVKIQVIPTGHSAEAEKEKQAILKGKKGRAEHIKQYKRSTLSQVVRGKNYA